MPALINLCGHGTFRTEEESQEFVVPENVEIHFYITHGGFYDNCFEPYIRQGGNITVDRGRLVKATIEPRELRQIPDRLQGRFKDFQPCIIRGGESCPNYRLGFGFGLEYCFSETSEGSWPIHEWTTVAPHRLIFEWQKEYDLFVSTPGLQVPLKEICERVAGGDSLILRWFACREEISSSDPRGVFLPNPTNLQRTIPGAHTLPASFGTLDGVLTDLESKFGGGGKSMQPGVICTSCGEKFRSKIFLSRHACGAAAAAIGDRSSEGEDPIG